MENFASSCTEKEKLILGFVQNSLPDSTTPFADLAKKIDMPEADILNFLRLLASKGIIRRFGAVLNHDIAGYKGNIMVAWLVPISTNNETGKIHELGALFAAQKEVSHCYHRPGNKFWPYNLYTMVHAPNLEDCMKIVENMALQSGLEKYQILPTLKELKKTSMHYFLPFDVR